jgi:hypothetical protein
VVALAAATLSAACGGGDSAPNASNASNIGQMFGQTICETEREAAAMYSCGDSLELDAIGTLCSFVFTGHVPIGGTCSSNSGEWAVGRDGRER